MSVPADRFDEIRRKWIARHQHTFIFQKRRAEILARQIRDRAAEKSGARVDPADDDVIHPLIARPVKTIYAGVDMAIVCTAALLAPLGWMGGKAIYRMLVQLIPGELRSLSGRGLHVGRGGGGRLRSRCCISPPTHWPARCSRRGCWHSCPRHC